MEEGACFTNAVMGGVEGRGGAYFVIQHRKQGGEGGGGVQNSRRVVYEADGSKGGEHSYLIILSYSQTGKLYL
jgi:hypothetical protein